jgi:hypothetical protein
VIHGNYTRPRLNVIVSAAAVAMTGFAEAYQSTPLPIFRLEPEARPQHYRHDFMVRNVADAQWLNETRRGRKPGR